MPGTRVNKTQAMQEVVNGPAKFAERNEPHFSKKSAVSAECLHANSGESGFGVSLRARYNSVYLLSCV
jgi:hypothetical protein